MPEYFYVIVGGGMTAAAAAQGIRTVDSTNPILILSEENHSPYDRPPLSKALWKGKPIDTIEWAIAPAEIWPERKSPTGIFLFFIRIFSNWGTRRLGNWTHAWISLKTGKIRFVKV